MGITLPGPERGLYRAGEKGALFPSLLVFLGLGKVSGGLTRGEAASQPNFFALDFFSIAISPQFRTPPPPAPERTGDWEAHLVQTLAAQVAHGLLDALWQWLACALHMDERWHPKHMLALVIWGFVPFHELGNCPIWRSDRDQGRGMC